MAGRIVRYMLVAQTISLLFAAGMWWRVWRSPSEPAIQDAAFWTALIIAQTVVIVGVFVLRSR